MFNVEDSINKSCINSKKPIQAKLILSSIPFKSNNAHRYNQWYRYFRAFPFKKWIFLQDMSFLYPRWRVKYSHAIWEYFDFFKAINRNDLNCLYCSKKRKYFPFWLFHSKLTQINTTEILFQRALQTNKNCLSFKSVWISHWMINRF